MAGKLGVALRKPRWADLADTSNETLLDSPRAPLLQADDSYCYSPPKELQDEASRSGGSLTQLMRRAAAVGGTAGGADGGSTNAPAPIDFAFLFGLSRNSASSDALSGGAAAASASAAAAAGTAASAGSGAASSSAVARAAKPRTDAAGSVGTSAGSRAGAGASASSRAGGASSSNRPGSSSTNRPGANASAAVNAVVPASSGTPAAGAPATQSPATAAVEPTPGVRRRIPRKRCPPASFQAPDTAASSGAQGKRAKASAQTVAAAPLPDASEEDWQRRGAKRRIAVAATKASAEYAAFLNLVAEARWPSTNAEEGEETSLPRTPDAADRSISKRRWEEEVRQWRAKLRHGCCLAGIAVSGGDADDEEESIAGV